MKARVPTGDLRTIPVLSVMIAAIFIVGCGDIESTDPRKGYTKAPLEEPGLFVGAEEPTEMDRLGEPRVHVPQESQSPFILVPAS